MNRYRCETCKKDGCDNHPSALEHYEKFDSKISNIIWENQHLFAQYGCASHSDFQSGRDIEQLKKAIIDVLDTGFESSEMDIALVLDRIDAWEKGELRKGGE